jgi:hypothetical protein
MENQKYIFIKICIIKKKLFKKKKKKNYFVL